MKITLPISNGFYVSESLPLSNQRCVNFYPNLPQSDTVTQDNLFPTPGVVEAASVSTTDVVRGSHEMDGKPYFVIGGTLYRLDFSVVSGDEVFTPVSMGTIAGVERVWMADNGTQLCIVVPPGSTAGVTYVLQGSTLTTVTDVNFDGPAESVVYIDSFFSFHKSNGKKFFNSPLGDARGSPSGAAYDPLDFSTAEADPDQIRAQGVLRNQLYILGSETVEVQRNIGRSPAPFQRIPGAVLDVGIVAPKSIEVFAGSLTFVGAGKNESPAVWTIAGTSKQKISTTAIDKALSDLSESNAEEIFSWSYSESGAFFYGITLPTTTFVFDAINRRWHERQSIKGSSLTQCRAANAVQAYGRIFVGDLQSGKIGYLDKDVYLEYGRLIRRFVTSKPFDDQGEPVFVASVEAVVEAGVGLSSDITVETGSTALGVPVTGTGGLDPQITYSWSDDGGKTFIGDRSRSLGKIGEFKRRPIWNRGGRFPRSRVLRFEIAAPNKAVIIKVEADIG